VGSTNQVKVAAIAASFPGDRVIGLESFQSAVSEEPMGQEETLQGALYRAKYAQQQHPKADMWIGIESGFYREGKDWIVIVSLVFVGKGFSFSLWSEPLVCPISERQRLKQIQKASLEGKKKIPLDKDRVS